MPDEVEEVTQETEDKPSLYSRISELASLPYSADDYDSYDEYKAALVRHFGVTYPATEEGNKAFETELAEDIQDWLNEATQQVKENRGQKDKRKRKKLPVLEGLDDQAEVGEDGQPKKRRGRQPKPDSEKKTRKQKAAKEPKERKPNRYVRAAKVIVSDLSITKEGLHAKVPDLSESTASHCLEAWHGITSVLTEVGLLKPLYEDAKAE